MKVLPDLPEIIAALNNLCVFSSISEKSAISNIIAGRQTLQMGLKPLHAASDHIHLPVYRSRACSRILATVDSATQHCSKITTYSPGMVQSMSMVVQASMLSFHLPGKSYYQLSTCALNTSWHFCVFWSFAIFTRARAQSLERFETSSAQLIQSEWLV